MVDERLLMLKLKSQKKTDLAKLIEQRKQHAAAIATIDAKLQRIGKRLGSKEVRPLDAGAESVVPPRHQFSISQEDLARITGYSVRAIAGIEAGNAPSKSAARKFKEVTRLLTALSELMPAAHVGEWMRRPNDAFQGQSPLHIMERGEADQIWEMIHQIDANVAN